MQRIIRGFYAPYVAGEEYEMDKLLTVPVSASGLSGGEGEIAPPTPKLLHQLSNSYKKVYSSYDISIQFE